MNPRVSICIITYNHEQFIAQTIDSVLMQEVDFEFEIVVGDDESKDNTRAILEQYQLTYPDIINLMPKNKNVGPTKNFAKTLLACEGQYIALLDGDDYWTCKSKIQRQVEFLDNNPDYSTCFHATQLVNRQGRNQTILPTENFKKPSYIREDLINYFAFMATSSVMFRNKYSDSLPPIFFTSDFISDWTIHMLNAETGSIGYIDDVMAVYRSNSSNDAFTAKQTSKIMIEEIKIHLAFNKYLDFKYNDIFMKRISVCYYKMSIDYFRRGDIINSIKAIKGSMNAKFDFFLLLKAIILEGPINLIKNLIKNFIGKILFFKD
tara:strand:+ start:1229 stop:2188 length:960 start_codon:yes stop_codon:yes gene_type:complete